jgi:hypothetical protein
MSSNYATPQAKISTEMTAAALFAALEGRPPTEREREAIEEAARERFDAYRDGVELDEVGDE